jgi:hypothetical protein
MDGNARFYHLFLTTGFPLEIVFHIPVFWILAIPACRNDADSICVDTDLMSEFIHHLVDALFRLFPI